MNRRQFLRGSALAGLAALLPLPTLAAQANGGGPAFDKLGLRLLAQMNPRENHCLSPYSLARALALVTPGARGQTEKELLTVLGFGNRKALLQANSRQDLSVKEVTLKEANSVWFDDSLPLKASYRRCLERQLKAQFYQTDFDGDAPGSARKINDWASRSTEGKIPEVVSPNPALRCLLANAVYFKGDWKTAFLKQATRPRPFLAPEGKLEVPMMSQTGSFAYRKGEGASAVRLLYKGDDTAMTIYLPDEGVSLASLQRSINFQQWRDGLARTKVHVQIPKFKLERTYPLNKPLQAMGVRQAFQNNADFLDLSQESLKIDKVTQKTYIEVDEKGTEAAAVTTIGMVRTTSVQRPPISFVADRPFLYTLEHLPSKTLLFLGQVTRPG